MNLLKSALSTRYVNTSHSYVTDSSAIMVMYLQVSNFPTDTGPHKILLYLWSVCKMPLTLQPVNN